MKHDALTDAKIHAVFIKNDSSELNFKSVGAEVLGSVSSPKKSSYHTTNSCTGLVRTQGGVFGIMHPHKK